MLTRVRFALVLCLVLGCSRERPPAPPQPAAEASIPPAELTAAAASVLPQFLQDRKDQGYGDDLEIVKPTTEVLRSDATDASTRVTLYTRRMGKQDGVLWVLEVPLHKDEQGWNASKYHVMRKVAVPTIEE